MTAVAKSIGREPWPRARTEAGWPHTEETRKVGVSRSAGGGEYLAGVRAGLPFALATGVLGVSFGVLARSPGLGSGGPDRVFGHHLLRARLVRGDTFEW